jgi:hypothetical protein
MKTVIISFDVLGHLLSLFESPEAAKAKEAFVPYLHREQEISEESRGTARYCSVRHD